jgi:hypothetical protein
MSQVFDGMDQNSVFIFLPFEYFTQIGVSYSLRKLGIMLQTINALVNQRIGHPPFTRRTSAVGRDTISHPDRGHDDVANAVAGAAALSKFGAYDTSMRWVSDDDDDSSPPGLRRPPVGFR